MIDEQKFKEFCERMYIENQKERRKFENLTSTVGKYC